VVTRLLEGDLLRPDEAGTLYRLIETRNRIVHGDVEFDVGRKELDDLITIASHVSDHLKETS